MAGKLLKRKKNIVGGDIGPAASLDNPNRSKPARRLQVSRRNAFLLAAVALVGLLLLITQFDSRISACSKLPEQSDMVSIAGEILEKKGYENDPNCLYLLTESFIAAGDSNEARRVFDIFITKHNGKGLSIKPADRVRSVAALKNDLEALEQNTEDTTGDIRFLPGEPSSEEIQ